MSTRYVSYYSVSGGTRFEGVTGTSHNSVLRRTRRLFSGEGYRAVVSESGVGYLVLERPDGLRALIEVEVDRRR